MRRLYFGQGKAIKEICRELGLSRKAVRRVLRSGATAFRYEGKRQPLPKLGEWPAELDKLLEACFRGQEQRRCIAQPVTVQRK